MRFDIVTIFPGFFNGFFDHGVVKRALAGDLLSIQLRDLRDFAHDRHRTVDDRPFGGGEGMVFKPEPLAECLDTMGIAAKGSRSSERVILLSAQGSRFAQGHARRLAQLDRIVLICGRYEGVDERVNELFCDEELSIGDFVLSGGELAAAVVLDATMRLIPGVLGNEASSEFESFGQPDPAIRLDDNGVPRSQHGAGGLLDYPHYTRPAEFRGLKVPQVLLGGNHDQIRRWRREQSLRKTWLNRPDLLSTATLTEEDSKLLDLLRKEQSERGAS